MTSGNRTTGTRPPRPNPSRCHRARGLAVGTIGGRDGSAGRCVSRLPRRAESHDFTAVPRGASPGGSRVRRELRDDAPPLARYRVSQSCWGIWLRITTNMSVFAHGKVDHCAHGKVDHPVDVLYDKQADVLGHLPEAPGQLGLRPATHQVEDGVAGRRSPSLTIDL